VQSVNYKLFILCAVFSVSLRVACVFGDI